MNTRYFTSRLLALMLVALLVFSCAAAEKTEIPSGVVDNFVQSEIEKQQSASDATAFEAGAAAGEYYADFTFGGVQTLSGITTTLSPFFADFFFRFLSFTLFSLKSAHRVFFTDSVC